MKTTAILLASAAMLVSVSALAQSDARSTAGHAANSAATAAGKAGTATENAIDKAADKATSSPGVDRTKPATKASNEITPGAPVVGANSFTEGQAKTRIEARGFANVTGLKKDDHGIWRGSAQKNGKATSVALDYQGNVVEGSAPVMSGSSTPAVTPAPVTAPPAIAPAVPAPPPAAGNMTTPPGTTPNNR